MWFCKGPTDAAKAGTPAGFEPPGGTRSVAGRFEPGHRGEDMSSRDPKAWMWAEACDFLDRAERLHRQFFQLESAQGQHLRDQRPAWQPPVDLFETEHELQILVALPGVEVDQLQVVIDGGSLSVLGERRVPLRARSAAIHRIEIPYGRFERRIQLPPGSYELDRRELDHGCLLLTLRKLDR
jgi:HSP20 family molecular chaperone IbpA